MVLYRKYRPQNFSELIGLEEVKKSLTFAKASDKVAHAYLFSGPRGTGKTTTARILAKIINCSNPTVSGEPCETCDVCQGIADGQFLDLLEIDAASNRGIDEIRDLREKIKLAPTQGKYKVYIIDEVHMLTTEAFNALLKTLEEPPAHAVFILCTTENHKLPATILSRCLKFEFKMPDIEQLKNLLLKIANEETIKLNEENALELAKAAKGAYRDALVLLEKFSSTGTIENHSKEGGSLTFFSKFIKGDQTKEMLSELDEILSRGVNLRFIIDQMFENLRTLLLIKVGIKESLINFTQEEKEAFENLSGTTSQQRINFLMSALLKASENLRISPIPQLGLELAIIESGLDLGEDRKKDGKIIEDKIEVKMVNKTEEEKTIEVSTDKEGKQTEERAITAANKISIEPSKDLKLEDLRSKWEEILMRIKPINRSLEALLRNCQVQSIEKGLLTLGVAYKFHKEIAEEAKNRTLIEKILSQYFETPVRIKCVLGEKKVRVKKEVVEEEKKSEKVANDNDLMNMAADLFSQN